ncbi:MAG: alpha-ketoglutarate-dependent dioxygenase AlkB [Chitinophagales bacterium]
MTRPISLPYDGHIRYVRCFESSSCQKIYQALFEQILWQPDQITLFGKTITTRRLVAWYGEQPFSYTYSKNTKTAMSYTPLLRKLQDQVSEAAGTSFNSCLLNFYPDGNTGMGWHSDDEPELQLQATIASLSFGAARSFKFRHRKTGETISLLLESGSLLLMEGCTQEHWLHQLPVSKKVTAPRINLTFRTMRT